MRRVKRLRWAAALVVGAGVLVAPAAVAVSTAAGDVQVLPRYYSDVPSGHMLLGASSDYVMHDVADTTYDGTRHLTLVRTSDGSIAWGGFSPSADASWEGLVGDFYVEETGSSGRWPDAVRFFDVETHLLVGQIAPAEGDTVVALGPGWILTSRETGVVASLSAIAVINRVDGSSVELPEVAITNSPTVTVDGGDAWVTDGQGGPLFHVDVTAGTVTSLPVRDGLWWREVIVGPTTIFNVVDQGNRHFVIGSYRKDGQGSSVVNLDTGHSGNPDRFLARGNGLAVYQPPAGPAGGTVWPVDLDTASLGPAVISSLADAQSMGGGKIAMVDIDQAPGTLAIDDGTGPSPLADLPAVSAGANTIAYDGDLTVGWDDGYQTIDPNSQNPTWTPSTRTTHQRVTTSGNTALVNDLNDSGFATFTWHLLWPGGHRDFEAVDAHLGHGGELVSLLPLGATLYTAQRVGYDDTITTGENVVTDGSWVWKYSPDTADLFGFDAGNNDTSPVSLDTGQPGTTLVDVRGRWALLRGADYTVIDTLGVVDPLHFPRIYSPSTFSPPGLGAGFVVYSSWTPTGYATSVTDLSGGHQTRELVDPDSASPPDTYTVDEAGSASLAYLDAANKPKILHIPWLTQQPLPDSQAPALDPATGSVRFTGLTRLRYHFHATDDDAVASYDVGVRTAANGFGLGPWNIAAAQTTHTTLRRTATPGSETCFRFRARDSTGNASAWSPARCSTVAIQDAAFINSAGAVTRRSPLALDHRYTRLDGAHTWLKVPHQQGHTIAIWLITGPKNGQADVYVGPTRIGSLSSQTGRPSRELRLLALPHPGAIRIVSRGRQPTGIDAITVER